MLRILTQQRENGNAGYDKAFEAVWQKFATEKGLHQMPKMIAPEHHTTDLAILGQYIEALGPHYDRIHAFAHHYTKIMHTEILIR